MRFTTAYVSLYDNEIKMTVVEADSKSAAMLAGVRFVIGDESTDTLKWLDSLKGCTPEQISEAFFDTDQLVEVLQISEEADAIRPFGPNHLGEGTDDIE